MGGASDVFNARRPAGIQPVVGLQLGVCWEGVVGLKRFVAVTTGKAWLTAPPFNIPSVRDLLQVQFCRRSLNVVRFAHDLPGPRCVLEHNTITVQVFERAAAFVPVRIVGWHLFETRSRHPLARGTPLT